jgi:sugar phosphate isomerase/epimerase
MFDAATLDGRLGLDQPSGCWPAPPRLKSYEAAGFSYVQVRTPSRSLLSDFALAESHARALRENLGLTGLRPIVHGPDDLLAGTREHDRQLEGALRYAAAAGSERLIYHGLRISPRTTRLEDRLAAEERSLRRALRLAEALGVRIAIENLAPVYPGEQYVCYDVAAVLGLIDRLDNAFAGMCLDVGHAHIVAGLSGRDVVEFIAPALPRAIVFHLHDNFGADGSAQRAGGLEPVRLDLHLPLGAGSLPWRAVAPLLCDHAAPLQLEIHPGQRPEPATLAILTREVLSARSRAAAG